MPNFESISIGNEASFLGSGKLFLLTACTTVRGRHRGSLDGAEAKQAAELGPNLAAAASAQIRSEESGPRRQIGS